MSDAPRMAQPAPTHHAVGTRRQGYDAAEAGESRTSCPYKKHGRARTEWLDGFWRFTQGKPIVGCGSYEGDWKSTDSRSSMRSHTRAMFRGMRRRA